MGETYMQRYDRDKRLVLEDFACRGLLFRPGTGEYTELAEEAVEVLKTVCRGLIDDEQ